MRLLNIRLEADQHSDLKKYCKERGQSVALLLNEHIDSLLEGSSDPMISPTTKSLRSPSGYRKPRPKSDRTDLSCAHCGDVFVNASAVISHEEYCKGDVDRTLAYKKWWAKTRWTRNNIKTDKLGNRVEMRLSFEEYCMLLSEAGITAHDIGSREGEYCLGRYRDIGHYELENCRFVLSRMNLIENHYSELLIKLGKDPSKIPLDEYMTGLDSFIGSVENAVDAAGNAVCP